MIIAVISVIVMVVLDQGVKSWAITTLQAKGTIPIIENIFHLTYVENRGAAFSILQGKQWMLITMTFVVLAVLVIALQKGYMHTKVARLSVYFIIGGAIGNLLDRVFRSYVVDMFDFRLLHFPVFNIADIFVTIGGLLFVYYIAIQHDRV